MCLAIPGEIISREGYDATVDFGGTRQKIRLDLLPEAGIGDRVLVHVGYAIQVLDEEEAREILKYLQEFWESQDDPGD